MRKSICYAFAFFACLCSAILGSTALAAEKTFGPFSIDDAEPDIIVMDGPIEQGAALDFRRALRAAPDAKLITLNSRGGSVQAALLIADDINQRGLSTYIPKTHKCYSACSYIFLAGEERKVDGALGVHQISSDSPDLVGAQFAISDIIEVLSRFDTPPEVMQIMFKTPPDDMYVFNQDEIEQFRLNRLNTDSTVVSLAEENRAHSAVDQADEIVSEADSPKTQLEIKDETAARLSPLEEFTRRPNRIAVFAGLDLFGDDLSSFRVADASICAQRCLSMDGKCKAFTFNTNRRLKKGPNCFLKSSQGRADGNSVAFSGVFLSAAETDPEPISISMIDPSKALFEDIDLPGGDLSRRPHTSAKTALACRLACIDNNQCVAFTYIKPKKECWLKGAVGSPLFKPGLVTGVKSYETFKPARIITLN